MSAAVSSTCAARVPCSAKPALVGAEEVALADRRGGLQLVHRPRADRQLHQPHPPRDRPRGDHHHPLAAPLQLRDLRADRVEHVHAQLAVVGGDDRGAELDDEGHGRSKSRNRGAARTPGRRPARRRPARSRPCVERRDHADLVQALLQVGERLLVVEVMALEQQLHAAADDAEGAVAPRARPGSRPRPPGGRPGARPRTPGRLAAALEPARPGISGSSARIALPQLVQALAGGRGDGQHGDRAVSQARSPLPDRGLHLVGRRADPAWRAQPAPAAGRARRRRSTAPPCTAS